jgi:23S rRNA (uracil1939-C5)-methyltransferase
LPETCGAVESMSGRKWSKISLNIEYGHQLIANKSICLSLICSMKRGDIISNLLIDTMAAEGKCVARLPTTEPGKSGLVVFVTGGAPGDTVNAEITKIKNHFLEAKVTSIVALSANRSTPFCGHFGTCGGCSWQHINYATQLTYKQQQVTDALQRIGGVQLPPIQTILPSRKTQFYRNRLDFTFSASRWLTREELQAGQPFGEPGLGFHIPKMYDKVFDVATCYLQGEPSNDIRLFVKDLAVKNNIPFFDLRKQVGFLRTLTIRTSVENETMVILQVAYDKQEWIQLLMEGIRKQFNPASLNYIVNGKRNDTFADLDIVTFSGNPYITESMAKPDGSGKIFFRVGPKSFYQTNSEQAYQLYRVALDLADLKGHELVYDLYTGTGTIANFVASKSKKVVGLEYVAAAIEDAKVNASINNIGNTDFYAGDIKDLLNENFLNTHGKPDVVITDPPRAGMHEDVCQMLLQAAPQRIIYVSCNPATQARDLAILAAWYDVTAIQPVDMFPHTMHVENVVRLDIRG